MFGGCVLRVVHEPRRPGTTVRQQLPAHDVLIREILGPVRVEAVQAILFPALS